MPAVPPAGPTPSAAGAAPPLRPGPPAPAPAGRPGRLRAPHGPPGARPGGSLRERGERRGLTETGLYRVPGAEPLVREWRQKLLRAKGALPSLGRVGDVHVVCGVLKDFLRGLEERLL
ncbi:unnamed protein product [Lepidochelys kempii]